MRKLVINLYVGKEFEEFFDQIKVISEANGVSNAKLIGKAVKNYIKELNDDVDIINRDAFNKFLKTAKKEEILNLSTLICELNNKLIRKCQK